MTSIKPTRPAAAETANGPRKTVRAAPLNVSGDTADIGVKQAPGRMSRGSAHRVIATIDKSHSCQLRVSLSEWRGQHKVEIGDFSAVIPGTYFKAGAGITLDIAKLPTLIAALRRAEAAAVSAGYLTKRDQ